MWNSDYSDTNAGSRNLDYKAQAMHEYLNGEVEYAIQLLSTNNDLHSMKLSSKWLFEIGDSVSALSLLKKCCDSYDDLESIVFLGEYQFKHNQADNEFLSYWKLAASFGDLKSVFNLAKYLRSEFDVPTSNTDTNKLNTNSNYKSTSCTDSVDEDDDCGVLYYTKMAADLGCIESIKYIANLKARNEEAQWSQKPNHPCKTSTNTINKSESESQNLDDMLGDQSSYEWYLKAAKNGDPASYTRAGMMLYNGIGVQKNTNLAMELFVLGARSACQPGLREVGDMYMHLNSFEDNRDNEVGFCERALQLYEEGGRRGDEVALKQQGDCHLNGIGCESDTTKAKECYLRAIECGSVDAMASLALLYLRGGDRVKAQSLVKQFISKSCIEIVGSLDDDGMDHILDSMIAI